MDYSPISSYLLNLSKQIELYNQQAAMVASFDAYALINKRVVGKGIDADGEKFKDYSDTKLPKIFQKDRTGSGKKLKKLEDLSSYKEIRKANSLQVAHRDFKFTGRMWQNIKPAFKSRKKDVVIITIDADQPDLKKRVQYNNKIINDSFLRPSKQELDRIRKIYSNELLNRILK